MEAIVLAAGMSSRMGTPKPFLPYGNVTFIEVILARLRQAGFNSPIIVANPDHRERYGALDLSGCRLIYNDRVEAGMFRSLRLGLGEVSPLARHAMVCLADMPMIQGETYARLAAASSFHQGRILVTVHGGLEGHPVLWPRPLFGVLAHWPGDDGARGVIQAHAGLVTKIEIPDPAVLADVDTPAQYERLFERRPPGGAGENSDSGLA